MPRPSKRHQILEAAQRCFYEQGITATGVDAIAAAADVSKRTLYNHFPSKDDLLLAYIEWREQEWRGRLDGLLVQVDDPAERLLAYFDAYVAVPVDGYRGCAFINAAAEIADEASPVLAAIVASKQHVRRDLEALLTELGHDDATSAAAAIAALLEGSCALGGIHRAQIDLGALKQAALLIAGVPLPLGRATT